MKHPAFIWLVAVACLGIGSLIGAANNNAGWMHDCEKIGMHRSADTVYKCEVTK